MASTDHGDLLHDLALLLDGALRPATMSTSPAYRAALRIKQALELDDRPTVKQTEDKLYELFIEEDHAASEAESAFYRDFHRSDRTMSRTGEF